MKKIYMILAAITLLSMSLNAQTRAAESMTSTLTFTAKCGGSGTADDGAAWTVTSNGTESTFDSSRGIHYGTNSASVQYIELTTSDIHGTIKSVVVEASRASQTNGYVNVFVDGNQFGSGAQTLTSSNAAYTFTGEATGTILVRIYKNSNATRALYCKSITVTYEVDDPNTANLDLFSNTTDANMCLPVYGGYHDHTQHNQMVYPASLLTDMVGKKIKSMTFYPASVTYNGTTYSGIGFHDGSVTFKLMEVTNSTGFNSSNPSFITGSMTTVKTVTMPSSAQTSATTWKITFDQEYEYNGGDLVIDVTNATGDYQRTYFYTGTTSIAYPGYYTYSGSTGSDNVAVDYVPKVTFTFEDNEPRHDLGIALDVNPATVLTGETATFTATVTNNGNQTESGYTVTFSDGTTRTGGTLAPGATETFTVQCTPTTAGTVTMTATVACTDDSDATNDEATATLTVSVPVPALTAPENGETIEVGNNSGQGALKSITVSGVYLTENLTVSVSGTGFRVSPTTLTADAVNGGTTINVIYNGTNPNATGTLTISSGEVSVTVNLHATYSTGIEPTVHGMVRMGTLPIVDQFAEKIPPTNDHPYRYTYFLKLAARDTTSSPARVPVQHTGAEIEGYYSQQQMDDDTDPTNFLTTDMLSAEVDMNLSPASAPYFYTINSVKNGVPQSAEDWDSYLNVLQRREAGDYQEMQAAYTYGESNIPNPNRNKVYASGDNSFFDYRTIQATSHSDSLSYVPIVWTKGIDRHYYTTDSLHNSYGAPLWEVRTGSVEIQKPAYERQAKNANGDWNPSVNWLDENGQPCSLFMITDLHATGILPESNIEYEPYMFRLWVVCDALRNMNQVDSVGAVNDPDASRTSPKLLYTKYCHGADDLTLDITKNDSIWSENVTFGALNAIQNEGYANKPTFLVRFYYVVKGHQKPLEGTRAEGDEEHVGYVVDEEVAPYDPTTAVIEMTTHGEIVEQTFYNIQGMQSSKPFDGINIVVIRYSDGTTSTVKVIK